jgi:hypothetical protein
VRNFSLEVSSAASTSADSAADKYWSGAEDMLQNKPNYKVSGIWTTKHNL